MWSGPVGQAVHCTSVSEHIMWISISLSIIFWQMGLIVLINSVCHDNVPTGRGAFLKFSQRSFIQ